MSNNNKKKKAASPKATPNQSSHHNRQVDAEKQPLRPDARLPYRPFPIGVFPKPIREFIETGAASFSVDPVFMAMPVLAALASAIGTTREVEITDDWHESFIIWSAIVGYSGVRKSPPFEAAIAPIRHLQEEAVAEWPKLWQEHEAEMLKWKAQVKKWAKDTGGVGINPPKRPLPPKLKRYLCNETTLEAILGVLNDNPRGVILARDELSGFLGSFNKYRDGKGADEAQWLEMFNANQVIVDRKTSKPTVLIVPMASVNIAGTIQPETLKEALGKKHFKNGMAARLLVACPLTLPRRWTGKTIPPEVKQTYAEIIWELSSWKHQFDGGGRPYPIPMKLDEEAADLFHVFYDRHAAFEAAMSHADLMAASSKLEGYAARIAGIFAAVRAVTNGKRCSRIYGDSMRGGIKVVEWFRYETARVYGILSADAKTEADVALIDWLHRQEKGKLVSARDLHRAHSHRFINTEAARMKLDELETLGLGKWDDAEQTGPGAPKKGFRLNCLTESRLGGQERGLIASGDPQVFFRNSSLSALAARLANV